MYYQAVVTREGKDWLAEFPDCPGCQTFAKSEAELAAMALEALTGWMESSIEHGDVPSRPVIRQRAPRGAKLLRVDLPTRLEVALLVRWARSDDGLTQGDLAKRMGVSQQQVAKLERPNANPSIETLARLATALGRRLDLKLDLARAEAGTGGRGRAPSKASLKEMPEVDFTRAKVQRNPYAARIGAK